MFGRNEAYDVLQDSWEPHAPMATPRHGLGAMAIGEPVYVAGGVQSAVHEAFRIE